MEASLAMAMILQNFELEMDESYQFELADNEVSNTLKQGYV